MSVEMNEMARMFPLALALGLSALRIAGDRAVLGDERTMFANALDAIRTDARSRVAAAIERRRAAERIGTVPGWIGLALCWSLGLACVSRLIDASFAIALTIAVYVATIFAEMLTSKREGAGRRVASMAARTFGALVPHWLLAAPLLSDAIGIALAPVYGLTFPTLVTIATTLIALVSLPFAVRSPAIVSDEDRVTDELLDEKIRASRLRQTLIIAAYAPLLVAFTVHPTHDDLLLPIRTTWMMVLTALIVWSSRRVRFSQDDLRRMYGV